MDCSGCAALCCVALAFDRSEHFAFDKPAGVRCRHLLSDNTCAIHDHLELRGFGGCARYDCHGAGPRTIELFGEDFDAFAVMRDVHEMLFLLDASHSRIVTRAQADRRRDLEQRLARGSFDAVREAKELLRDMIGR